MKRFIAVDLFCGGGGASEGIRRALGVSPYLAINHDEAAIAMHRRNHPKTIHLHESVWAVDPWSHVPKRRGNRRIDLLWASPDCTHFSRARGGKPRQKDIRSLAEIVPRWARGVAPKIICVENVREFLGWGPLDENGVPIPKRKGETFRAWVAKLQLAGYRVEWRMLKCCDYGTPTSRERLFIVARCDGEPIVWPEPTHGPGRIRPYQTAAQCIDFSLPTPSIFMTREESRAYHQATGIRCKRPLAEKTLRRIAAGVKRFVLEAARPFILTLTHGGRLEPIDEPMRTITTASRGERALVVPTLIQVGYGERKEQRPRVLDLSKPLGTVTASGNKFALVSAFMTKFYGTSTGASLAGPVPVVTGQGQHLGLVTAHLTKFYGASTGADLQQPAPTVTGQAKFGLVAAFLQKYYSEGSQGQPLHDPMGTVTTKARFGLVTVQIDGDDYAIADIGMRMLTPRELATAQGLPADYELTGTKTAQIERIGNAVPPQPVEAVVRAQFPKRAMRRAS